MKKMIPLSLLIIVAFVLVAGCFTQIIKNTTVENSLSPTTTSSINVTSPDVIQTTFPVSAETSAEIKKASLSVSIGDYTSLLPVLVFIDNISAGNVSKGKPLDIMVSEGTHTLKVCNGEVCEQVDVDIKFALKTSIDFEERLKIAIPQGLLILSIGDNNVELPVFIDNMNMGVVSPDKPLNVNLSVGRHTAKICVVNECMYEDVLIISSNPTTIDFGERLKKELVSGMVTVSIGGYNAELPVFIDNMSVGIVSPNKPLNLMVGEGHHLVKVCIGILCENEEVEIKFAKPVYIDFGKRLKRVAEFPTPNVRIIGTRQADNEITVDLEFINPSKNDLTMIAKIQCAYSYIDNVFHWRHGNAKQGTISTSVKAGNRTVESLDIYLTGGSSYIIENPVILDFSSH